MGSAGHAFLSHTKALSPAASVRDGGWGPPPHPLEVRPGQRYWPRAGRRKRPLVIRRCTAEAVLAQRLDGEEERLRLTRTRLLAVREQDGQGRHYVFGGHVSRRYATHAVLVAIESDQAVLVVPEWHPGRPVRLPLRQLPLGTGTAGTWYRVQADLGAASAPRLSLAGFAAIADPGPAVAHRPTWSAAEEPPAAPASTPASGRGCGDIVVELSSAAAQEWLLPTPAPTRRLVLSVQRPPEVHQTGPTPTLGEGARIYLANRGRLIGFVTTRSQRPHPNGEIFTTAAELHAPEAVAPVEPFHNWRWRWWPLPESGR